MHSKAVVPVPCNKQITRSIVHGIHRIFIVAVVVRLRSELVAVQVIDSHETVDGIARAMP